MTPALRNLAALSALDEVRIKDVTELRDKLDPDKKLDLTVGPTPGI